MGAADAAKRDALRDSMSTYGRAHKGRQIKGRYSYEGRRNTFIRETIPQHHTGEAFVANCVDCQKDASSGSHPRSPKGK